MMVCTFHFHAHVTFDEANYPECPLCMAERELGLIESYGSVGDKPAMYKALDGNLRIDFKEAQS